MRCSGEGASSGAEDGCEHSALSFVTLGCESLRTRLVMGMVFDLATGAGLEQISQSGSRSSKCSVWGCPGAVLPTTIVTESVSDSKLRMEFGVMANCCTCKFIEARGFSCGDAAGF